MTRGGAALSLVFVAMLWSIGGVLIKVVDWNPLAIAGGRSTIAAVFLGVALTWSYSRAARAKKTAGPSADAVPARILPRLSWPLFGAAASVALCMLLFVTATRLTTAANAVVLQYLAPIHVALIAPKFLGEKTHPRDWLALVLALGGLTLFFWGGVSAQGRLGILLAVGTSFAFAGIPLFLRRMGSAGGQTEAVLLGNTLLALVCLPFYFKGSLPSLKGIGALLILGVFQVGLAYFIYSKVIRHVRALEALLIPVIEPTLNPVWVFLFIGERPSTQSIIGGALVLGAAVMQGLLASRGR